MSFRYHPDKQDQCDSEAIEEGRKKMTELTAAKGDLVEMLLRETKMRQQRDAQAEMAAAIRRTRDMTSPWNVFVERSQGAAAKVPMPSNGVGAYVRQARDNDPNVSWSWPHAPECTMVTAAAKSDGESRNIDEFYVYPLVEGADCATFLPSGELPDFGESSYRLVRVCSQRHLNENSSFVLMTIYQGHGSCSKPLADQYALALARALDLPVYVLSMTNPKSVGGRQYLWNTVTTAAERGKDAAIDCGHIIGKPVTLIMKMHDNLIATLADRLPRVVGKVNIGESVGGYGLLGQSLYARRADVLLFVGSYAGGTMDEAQIRITNDFDCVRANPGIQKRTFASWLERAPELAKYPLIIFLHCEGDKLSSYPDMVLLSDTIIAHGGNVIFHGVPKKVAKPNAKSKDNFHTFFWQHLEKRTFEDKVWAPLRDHFMNTQYTAVDRCNTTYTDPAWEMPSRVPAAEPSTTGDPAAADSQECLCPLRVRMLKTSRCTDAEA